MASLSRSIICRMIPALVLLALLAFTQTGLSSQEAAKYTAEEYKAYQDVANEPDAAKKVDMAVKFMQTYPQSALRPHVTAAYQAVMKELQSAEKWTQLILFGERFAAVAPNDLYTASMLATGYQKTKQYAKFVAYGEKVYEKEPNGNLAYYLAKAYQDLNNDAKFLQWGERAVGFMPDSHELLLELTRRFAAAKQDAPASKYARQCIKAAQSAAKPEATADKVWKDYISTLYATCYAVIGNVAYEQRDYKNAILNLENSLRYYRRNELACYYLGLSYWQTNRIDVAMLNLAKAYLLKGNSSRAAKQHLDNLYKSTHQQSLVGIERILERAAQDLK